MEDYVHRIGRTGRAGASGRAVAVVDGRSVGLSPRLVDILGEAAQPVPSWLAGMAHVARARKLDEEGAIAAGGGGGDWNGWPSALPPQDQNVDAWTDNRAVSNRVTHFLCSRRPSRVLSRP